MYEATNPHLCSTLCIGQTRPPEAVYLFKDSCFPPLEVWRFSGFEIEALIGGLKALKMEGEEGDVSW
jgi:hypothetical protein